MKLPPRLLIPLGVLLTVEIGLSTWLAISRSAFTAFQEWARVNCPWNYSNSQNDYAEWANSTLVLVMTPGLLLNLLWLMVWLRKGWNAGMIKELEVVPHSREAIWRVVFPERLGPIVACLIAAPAVPALAMCRYGENAVIPWFFVLLFWLLGGGFMVTLNRSALVGIVGPTFSLCAQIVISVVLVSDLFGGQLLCGGATFLYPAFAFLLLKLQAWRAGPR